MGNIAFFGKLVNIFVVVNIRHTLWEILSQPTITCSKATIETLEQDIYFTPWSSVSIVNFEQINASWVMFTKILASWNSYITIISVPLDLYWRRDVELPHFQAMFYFYTLSIS